MNELLIEKPILNDETIDDRAHIVKLVRRWAEVNSDGLLDDKCSYFSLPSIEGFIGYHIEHTNAVVCGEPVCEVENKKALALAFQEYCENQNLGVIYTIISDDFANWGAEHLAGTLIEFGEKFILNPLDNPVDRTGPKSVLVRKKVKHALKDHVIVEEYLENDPLIENGIEEAADSWLKARKGPQIYLSRINLFGNRLGKRWFYAKKDEKIIGLLVLNRLESYQGWLLNNVMYTKEAPHGTSELLVITALRALEKENCHFVLVGPIPGQQLGKINGLNNFSAACIRWFYQIAKKIFKLSGHESFWEKFQPTLKKSYLLFPKKNITIKSLKALLCAYNAGK